MCNIKQEDLFNIQNKLESLLDDIKHLRSILTNSK